jgi:hypothetical protein
MVNGMKKAIISGSLIGWAGKDSPSFADEVAIKNKLLNIHYQNINF